MWCISTTDAKVNGMIGLRISVRLAVVAVGVFILRSGLMVAPARAADIVVDTLADVVDPPFAGGGVCGTGTVTDLPGADIPALLVLVTAGERAFCELDDANGDGNLDAADLGATVTALFAG